MLKKSLDGIFGVPKFMISMLVALISCGCIVLFLYVRTFGYALSNDAAVWGQFGDLVGGLLNPLVAISALVAVLYSISLQRREFSESSKQLRAAAEASSQQNALIMRQSFETMFFQLIALFSATVRDLRIDGGGPNGIVTMQQGRGCLLFILAEYKNSLEGYFRGNYVGEDLFVLMEKFQETYSNYGNYMGYYMRTFANVLRYIDVSALGDDEKRFYANILRSQLTEGELILILLFSKSDFGKSWMEPLVSRYNIFKHVRESGLWSSHFDKLLVA